MQMNLQSYPVRLGRLCGSQPIGTKTVLDVEDGSPPKRRRPPSSSGSDPKRNKVTAGSNV